jgi:hypothetical protein
VAAHLPSLPALFLSICPLVLLAAVEEDFFENQYALSNLLFLDIYALYTLTIELFQWGHLFNMKYVVFKER